MDNEDYKVFIPLYEDGIVFERWKSVAEMECYKYFDTFNEAKADLIDYYQNAIQDYQILLRKAQKIELSIGGE